MEEDCLKEIRCANCRQDHRTCLQKKEKKKRNTWGETQEEYILPGSNENCGDLHVGKQLRVCCTEGEYNESRQQI